MNHHGPLSVNSGGVCGGHGTASNLVGLIGSRGAVGDLIVLVGDFNANAASLTIQQLWPHLVHIHSGDSWGGVDNIFSNVDDNSVVDTQILGSGGSDHDAISAILSVGPELRASSKMGRQAAGPLEAVMDLTKFAPGYEWEKFWCGQLEPDIEYKFPDNAWNQAAPEFGNPESCCRACQAHPECKAWVWIKWVSTGPLCKLSGAMPSGKSAVPLAAGIVSGLTAQQAATVAGFAAKSARRTMD